MELWYCRRKSQDYLQKPLDRLVKNIVRQMRNIMFTLADFYKKELLQEDTQTTH